MLPNRCAASPPSRPISEAIAAWWGACAITTVALASTGVSWIPLFALLEARGFAVLLVDPPQVQKIKGRPTSDVHDCQGRQRLHTFGLAGQCVSARGPGLRAAQ